MIHLSDDTFELFLHQLYKCDAVDLRDVSFIDPYGMVGILEAGRLVRTKCPGKILLLPESDNVLRYLERMDFFKYASFYYHMEPVLPELSERFLRSSRSDVLLEITPIEKSDDIHFIVGRVKKKGACHPCKASAL